MPSPTLFDLQDDEVLPESALALAVEALATQGGSEARGAVFTRREVVEFILDLVGYVEGQPLHSLRVLEPSFGGGDFLLPVIRRLVKAWKRERRPTDSAVSSLRDCIYAVELHRQTFVETHARVVSLLADEGLDDAEAELLADAWLHQDDFLLHRIDEEFDFVVGNPPYVRQELIPAPLLAEYRRRFTTVFDRADLYIPFFERSLRLLNESGKLGFICADRWMKNRYGGPLRELVADHFSLTHYVDMVDTDAFHSEVSTYPAITVVSAERNLQTRVAYRPKIESAALNRLAKDMGAKSVAKSADVKQLPQIAVGADPWLLDATPELILLRRLEQEFPTLEEAGCKVGIGVATGADRVFIAPHASLDVEDERKLALATTADIKGGEVQWQGNAVLNPFAADGKLVDLAHYPKFARYLEENREAIAGRHCAKKSPSRWYRTIDRIWPALATQPKLLIPDIKGEAHIVYEEGKLYPHHNLYYITSAEWNLRALQAVLLSFVSKLFVSAYSTKMRGGYLRFQAQYLRRIRIPRWDSVSQTMREKLQAAAKSRDVNACNAFVAELYGLSSSELSSVPQEDAR